MSIFKCLPLVVRRSKFHLSKYSLVVTHALHYLICILLDSVTSISSLVWVTTTPLFLFFFSLIECFVCVKCRIIRISPFANRLSFDAPPAVQRLRCLANYEALRFSNPILGLGETLVSRMKERSVNNSGKYISVHLRFEEVSFMCVN